MGFLDSVMKAASRAIQPPIWCGTPFETGGGNGLIITLAIQADKVEASGGSSVGEAGSLHAV
jgi:hypothetical protein